MPARLRHPPAATVTPAVARLPLLPALAVLPSATALAV